MLWLCMNQPPLRYQTADIRKRRNGTLQKSVCLVFFSSENERNLLSHWCEKHVKGDTGHLLTGFCLNHGLNQSNYLATVYRDRDQDSLGRKDPLLVKSKMLNFTINSNILKSLEGHFHIFYRVFFRALYRENPGKQSIWPQNQKWPKAFLPNSFRPQKLLQPILEMGWTQCTVTRASCAHNSQLVAHILARALPTNNPGYKPDNLPL